MELTPSPPNSIQGRVWTTLLALPENVAVDVKAAERERPITRSVILSDEWQEGELARRKIESTAGDRLKIDVKRASGPVIIQGLDVKKRCEPTLTYTPGQCGVLRRNGDDLRRG